MNTNRMTNLAALSRLSGRLNNPIRRKASVREYARQPALLGSRQETNDRIKRILVPLDGSAFAEHAIPLALGIAQQCDAVLQLVHVLVPAAGLSPFEVLQLQDAAIKERKNHKLLYLSKIAHQISTAASVGVSSAVINGIEVSSALDETYGDTADLVVMATHGRGPLGRFWWGSVAHSLVQKASVPLVLVKGNAEKVDLTPQTINNVILPIDGDKRSQRIVEPLLRLGVFAGARHTLLHVTRPELRLVARGERLHSEWVPSVSREAVGMKHLRPVADCLSEGNRQVDSQVVSSEKPAWQVVSRHANRCDHSLVACTYLPPRLLERVVRTGLPEHLLRALTCPLMLIPS